MGEGKRKDFDRFIRETAAWREANAKPPRWRDYSRAENGAPTLGDLEAPKADPCPPDGPVPMECGGERLTLCYALRDDDGERYPPYAV